MSSRSDAPGLSNAALPFLAGALTASVAWYFFSSSSSSRGGPRGNFRDDTFALDEDNDDASRSTNFQSYLFSSMDDIKSRIGELPRRLERSRWPWQDLRRGKSSESSGSPKAQNETLRSLSSITSDEQAVPVDEKSDLCIGSIFGLDVGGTLAKLVYFEEGKCSEEGTNGEKNSCKPHHRQTQSVASEVDLKSLHALAPQQQHSSHRTAEDSPLRRHSDRSIRKSHSDDAPVDTFATAEKVPNPIPKSKSMFDLAQTRDREEALDRFYNFARHLDSFYQQGVRDHKLRFYSRELGGYIHFIHFETRRMEDAMGLIRKHNLQRNIREMGGTGGGAHKFAQAFQEQLGIEMKRQGELDSCVAGMQFVLSTVVGECYTFRPPNEKQPTRRDNFKRATSYGDYFGVSGDGTGDSTGDGYESADSAEVPPPESTDPSTGKVDEWWWSRKVQRDSISYSSTYPYLVVTIGTGVSVLRVDGPRKHERISGSTIGGGTYWGLIRLLTSFEQFDDVIRLAERGDPTKVDMMVGDIYGGNVEALEQLGLRADLVASSFGKLVAKEDPAEGLTEEDLARALLLMVTNNIGQVAYLNAKLHKTERIYFIGNFLRQNRLSQRRLAFAINYWSKGKMEALFLEHEGYFGALGAFLLSQDIPHPE
jgi:type II pantothenate kinase